MASDFNFSFLNNDHEFSFDLNKTPTREDVFESVDHWFSFDLNNTPPNEEFFEAQDDGFPFDINSNVYEEIIANSDSEMIHADSLNRTRKNLSNKERWAIYNVLSIRSVNGKLKKKTTREVSELFSVSISSVQRIWKRAKETYANDGEVDVSHKRVGRCGPKKMTIDLGKVAETPLHKRTTIRSLSAAMNVSSTTIHRRIKEGIIRRHSNAIKPSLTDENIKKRLQFCVSMLEKDTLANEPKFVDMYNIVHIDEKWFNMTKKTENYYLLPEEEEPHRTCQSKNFIGKVMFLAAMARPRFDEEGNEIFSGKIGIFPFVTTEPAKRRSKHRDAGTLEVKALTSVKREDIRASLINNVIPIIHEKWPEEDQRKTIFIQQDNARTHVLCDDKEFHEAASKNGFDIQLMCQPPNSPDLNILDLGFFRAIQAVQYKECPKTVEDLVRIVEKCFHEYPTKKVNHIFLTLQSCMKELMRVGGTNKYKIPHMKKSTLERQGCLPIQLSCDVSLVQNVMNLLSLTN